MSEFDMDSCGVSGLGDVVSSGGTKNAGVAYRAATSVLRPGRRVPGVAPSLGGSRRAPIVGDVSGSPLARPILPHEGVRPPVRLVPIDGVPVVGDVTGTRPIGGVRGVRPIGGVRGVRPIGDVPGYRHQTLGDIETAPIDLMATASAPSAGPGNFWSGLGTGVADLLKTVGPAYIGYKTTREVAKINMARAQQGLPPIDAPPAATVGADAATRQTVADTTNKLIFAGLGIAALVVLAPMLTGKKK
jgi:hypothetical protein